MNWGIGTRLRNDIEPRRHSGSTQSLVKTHKPAIARKLFAPNQGRSELNRIPGLEVISFEQIDRKSPGSIGEFDFYPPPAKLDEAVHCNLRLRGGQISDPHSPINRTRNLYQCCRSDDLGSEAAVGLPGSLTVRLCQAQ